MMEMHKELVDHAWYMVRARALGRCHLDSVGRDPTKREADRLIGGRYQVEAIRKTSTGIYVSCSGAGPCRFEATLSRISW